MFTVSVSCELSGEDILGFPGRDRFSILRKDVWNFGNHLHTTQSQNPKNDNKIPHF
jgi:hypothetical protein